MHDPKTILSIFFLLILYGCSSEIEEDQINSRPNFVFLFADDQTFHTIRALGNDYIQTPNLDKLVERGASFSHAYNMGGWHGAVCVASRSMIISGQSIWRAKNQEIAWKNGDSLALAQTWGRLMAANGYQTYMTGKWHVTAPSDYVFDVAKHERPGMPPDAWGRGGGEKKVVEAHKAGKDIASVMPIGYNRPIEGEQELWSPTDTAFGGFWDGGQHWSEVVKSDALDFIKQANRKETPFFMYLAFNAPHDPRQAPQSYLDLYEPNRLPDFPNFLPEYPWKKEIGCSALLRDEALAPFPRTTFAVKKHLQEYYAIISHLDAQIGEILDALEAAGNLNNTYVFFTADHGLAIGQHGLLGKQSLFDHSIRVPFMVSGPGIEPGKVYGQDIYLQDIMPTTLELAGIPQPDDVDFHSLWDILQSQNHAGHYTNGIYGCYRDLQRMNRKNGYKLIVYPSMDKTLLFNLNEDPWEMNDLSNDPKHHDRLQSMMNDLLALQKEMQDPLSNE